MTTLVQSKAPQLSPGAVKGLRAFVTWTIVVGCALVGLWQTNLLPLAAVWEALVLRFTLGQRRKEEEWLAYEHRLRHIDRIIAAISILSLFLYAPLWRVFTDDRAYTVIGHRGEVSYHNNFFLQTFNPFLDRVQTFEVGKPNTTGIGYAASVSASCAVTSGDGVPMRGDVYANTYLPFDGLPTAYRAAGSQNRLVQMEREVICRNFSSVMANVSSQDIPSTIALAARMTKNPGPMNELGLQYSGSLSVGGVHVYLVQ